MMPRPNTLSRMIQDLFYQIANEKNMAARMYTVAAFNFLEFAIYFVWLVFIKLVSSTHQFVDMTVIDTMLLYSPLLFAIPVLGVLAFKCYVRSEKDFLYWQVCTIAAYSVAVGYLCYLIGQNSFLAGIAIAGTPVMGLLLFDRKVIFAAVALNLCILFGVLTCVALGMLPSAPIYSKSSTMTDTFWVLSYAHLAIGKFLFIFFVIALIMRELRRKQRQIKRLSEYDELTGLYNRFAFQRQVHEHMAQHAQANVLLLDLDHFKSINDEYGHLVGDHVLQTVGTFLTGFVGEESIVGRFGGEEFIIYQPLSSSHRIAAYAESVRNGIAALDVVTEQGKRIDLTTSIGVASAEPDALSQLVQQLQQNDHAAMDLLDLLIQRADKALYQAKANGRNQVSLDAQRIELSGAYVI